APGAETIAGPQRLQKNWQGLGTQRFPGLRLAKKFGYVDENRIEQLNRFVWLLAHPLQVIAKRADTQLEHALANAALQRGVLVAAQVGTMITGQVLHELLQCNFVAHLRALASGIAQSSTSSAAICSTGNTRSAHVVATAAVGIGLNCAEAGSSTMVKPPAAFTARRPSAPSLPEPLNTTPMHRGP